MAEASDTLGILHQNLIDAGCTQEAVNCCMDCAKSGSWKGMLPVLKAHRQALLDHVRTGQAQLDCLDFLIYHINKEHQ